MLTSKSSFYVIAAIDSNGGIGKDGGLPWKLPEELAYFKKITTMASFVKTNAVIMGRKTWESIPEKFRPLKSRFNVVLTRSIQLPFEDAEGVLWARSLNEALINLAMRPEIEDIFVIGGAEVYRSAVKHPLCAALFLSLINGEHDCDTFFPTLERGWYRVAYEEHPGWKAIVYARDTK